MKKRASKALSLFLAMLMLCLTSFPTSAAESAATMQLMRTEGTVDVTNGSGRGLTKRNNMRLYNGYHVQTQAASYAWISLDSAKLAKLDAVSEVELRKSGKKLELLLSSGNLFFNVTSPLEEEETLNVRTATMVVGIRGTSGWLKVVDRWSTEIYVLEGTVQCDVTDPVTGQVKTATLQSGEKAVAAVYPQDRAGDKCGILQERIELEDIGGFVLEELARDPGLCAEILEASGLDVTDAAETVQERLEQDQREMREQLDHIESQQAEQDSDVSAGPVWSGEDSASNTPGAAQPSDSSSDSGSGGSSGGGSIGGNTGGSDDGGIYMPISLPDLQALLNQEGIIQVLLQPSANPADNILDIKDNFDLTVPAGVSLQIGGDIQVIVENGSLLIVEAGNKKTVGGTIVANQTITNYGTIVNGIDGEIMANITGSGTITNGGKIVGKVSLLDGALLSMFGGEVISSDGAATVTASSGARLDLNSGTITNSGSGYTLSIAGSDCIEKPLGNDMDIRAKQKEGVASGDFPGYTGVNGTDGYYHLRPEIETGDFIVAGGTSGTDYTYSGNVLTINAATPLAIRNKDKSNSTASRIAISDAAPGANITLYGVRINTGSGAAFEIPEGYGQDVTIILADGSVNELTSGANSAGLQKNDGASGTSGTLTITGGGELTVTGGEYAAGIGGGNGGSSSNITISGGRVTSEGTCGVQVSAGTFTITGNGELISTSCHTVNASSGTTLTLTGGTITHDGTGYYAVYSDSTGALPAVNWGSTLIRSLTSTIISPVGLIPNSELPSGPDTDNYYYLQKVTRP